MQSAVDYLYAIIPTYNGQRLFRYTDGAGAPTTKDSLELVGSAILTSLIRLRWSSPTDRRSFLSRHLEYWSIHRGKTLCR
jgi:hypothetical protein